MDTHILSILVVVFATFIGAFGPIELKKGSSKVNFKKLKTVYKNKL